MDDPVPSGDEQGTVGLPPAVPLFPLPNVVLFPRAVLPLHIFEERYKAMTADALNGDRLIAMALLQPGWEKCYYGRPQIDPVVCVGSIVSHERLADGNYNLLLQGQMRARLVQEIPDENRLYRIASLKPLGERPVMEIDLSAQRQRLIELFSNQTLSFTTLATQFRKLLSGPWPTPDIADLIAFNYFDDVGLKQALLAELDVHKRVQRTVNELESLRPQIRPPQQQSTLHPPSMN
jgi:Lon protease-like protein